MSASSSFELSIPAKNIEAKFYNKRGIVYVEGKDDLCFWAQFFDEKEYEIRDCGGCHKLEDYENDILYHGLRCIVAKDSDYSSYRSDYNRHSLIVCTLSHSIECVMYCPYNISRCLMKLARTRKSYFDEINGYYSAFLNDIKELIAYDIANNVYGVGRSVCGNSCCQFLESGRSFRISPVKRDKYISSLSSYFSEEQFSQALRWIDTDSRDLRQIAKGHFQTSFVINLLKEMAHSITGDRSLTITTDTLYAMLIECFEHCKEDCAERRVISQRVETAKKAL